MQHWLATLPAPASGSGRPLILIQNDDVAVALGLRGVGGSKHSRVEEIERRLRGDDANLVSTTAKFLEKLWSANRCDRARHADQNVRHEVRLRECAMNGPMELYRNVKTGREPRGLWASIGGDCTTALGRVYLGEMLDQRIPWRGEDLAQFDQERAGLLRAAELLQICQQDRLRLGLAAEHQVDPGPCLAILRPAHLLDFAKLFQMSKIRIKVLTQLLDVLRVESVALGRQLVELGEPLVEPERHIFQDAVQERMR